MSRRILLGLPALSASIVLAASSASGSPGLLAVRSSASPALLAVQSAPRVPLGARSTGAVAPASTVSGTVVLRPRDNAALVRFIAAVSDRSSPLFGQYLAPGAFAGRFGPTPATIEAVRSQLQAAGLRVTGVSSDGLLVNFTGSSGRVASAFHTGLESYRLADGSRGQATTSAVTIPATIAGSVTAVLGLDELVREQPAGIVRAPASARGQIEPAATAAFVHPRGSPTACAAATVAARGLGGLTDDQIANAYGAFGLYGAGDLGAGQRIAIYELEPFLRSDLETFDTCYFGATQAASMRARVHVVPVEGGQPSGPGSGEAILDVEDASALAPDATLDVYEMPSYGADGLAYDPIDEYAAMIDTDRDQVISSSWGLCEQAVQLGQPGLQQSENLLFEQAAAQGQTIFSAAGDNGADTCNAFETPTPAAGQNPVSVDDPASQPYVVGVGGTTITDAATQPPREQVWNDGATGGGGGGGISQSWTMPAWQQDATVAGIALPGSPDYANANHVEQQFGYPQSFCQATLPGASASTPCRLVPDVSSQGDELTGAITIYFTGFGGWSTIGGTSSSTPIWAALLADANASPTCASQPATRGGIGFANPLLYAVASNPTDYAASFNDITAGNNDIYGLDNGLVFPARTGYDEASGLGSPRLTGPGGSAGLAYYLCSFASKASRPAVTALSPASGATAGGTQVTITGTGFESAGTPDVASVQVGSDQLARGAFRVTGATSITATLPPALDTLAPEAPAPQDGAGAVQVIVTLVDGESSVPGPSSAFEYEDTSAGTAIPSLTGVIPVGGLESAPAPVTIFGSGFSTATGVSFGGVPAGAFTIDGPNRITATPPPYSAATTCAPLPTTGVYAGENATNDICQVQVQVASAGASSATGQILPPPQGPFGVDPMAAQLPPPGCGCELQQAPTEYDYLPAPTIMSVSTSSGPASLAGEPGGTVITVTGTGFDPLGIDWADFGPPSLDSSVDTNYVFVSGTELQIAAPPEPQTVAPASIPLRIRTLAGLSAPATVSYAGVPTVTRVLNAVNAKQLNGVSGGPSTGGTPIQINGHGFAGQLLSPLQFADADPTGGSFGTQYTFTVRGDTSISTETVAQAPGIVDVELCTVTGCSHNPPADRFYLYPPGDAAVASVSPGSGPAAGGTHVAIAGQNLGCALGVFFGSAAAESFSRVLVPGNDCASPTTLRAASPPGSAGASVPVSVATVESFFTGSGGTTSASFAYK